MRILASYALIGGTGVEHLALNEKKAVTVNTPYGEVTADVGFLGGQEVVFMSRHGRNHSVPPHLVNYRANIWALRKLGVKKILATAAVGSLSENYRLGDLVLLDQFLDFTKSRPQTFFEGGEKGVLHIDVTEPYCRNLQQVILRGAANIDTMVKTGATYVCTEGPRFETPAEIRMYQLLGGQVVGMTSVPETVLARELGMCYASIGMVTNEAAGIAGHPLTHTEVIESMQMMSRIVANLVEKTLGLLEPEQTCACPAASSEAGKF